MRVFKNSQFKINSMIEFSPSVSWLLVMVWPVIYQYSSFSPITKLSHLVIVLIVFLFLFAADLFAYKKSLLRSEFISARMNLKWLFLGAGIFFFTVTYHVYLMPKVPFLELLMEKNINAEEGSLLRESSGKLLNTHMIIKYLFMWSIEILAPILIVISLWFRYWRSALFFLIFAILYALSTSAKSPILLLLLTCFFIAILLPNRAQNFLSMVFCGGVLVFIFSITFYLNSGKIDHINDFKNNHKITELKMKKDDPRIWFTLGDIGRADSSILFTHSKLMTMWANNFYRLWLTPADVSHRWYQYYTYVSTPLLLKEFIPNSSLEVQQLAPSRVVGLWAYKERFPSKYGETVNAYASFDADAFARGGYWGVAIATFLIILARIVAAISVTNRLDSLIPYGIFLCFFSVMPSSASLQAIFGAHGLIFILIYLLGIHFLRRKR